MSQKSEDLKNDRVAQLLHDTPDVTFVKFKGQPLMSAPKTNGFAPISSELFKPLVYNTFGMGVSKANIADYRDSIENNAPDWSQNDHFIGFGDGTVWDTRTLTWQNDQKEYIYSSNVTPNDDPAHIASVQAYLLELSSQDQELAHDYLQIMAPLFMETKPVGIIWLLGKGANGKSAFLDAWYSIIGKHFAEQSLDMIEDGRSAVALRGILGNVVRDASEKRIEDDKHYKNMGAHESFPIRLLGTNETVTVDGNFHSVMGANNVPVFEDKSDGATRRTLLVPFNARFKDDPYFKARTFTPEFYGALVHLVLQEARHIRESGGYHWSRQTKALQTKYAHNANTAEAYADFLLDKGVVGFKNYTLLRTNYENWCSDMASNALGRKQLSRAFEGNMQVVLREYRDDNGVKVRRYIKENINEADVVWLEDGTGSLKSSAAAIRAEFPKRQAELNSEWGKS